MAIIRKYPNILAITTIVCVFIVTREFIPLYFSNQMEYYVYGFARANPHLLQNDWFIQTAPKHPAFTILVEALYRLNIIELGSYFFQVLLEAIMYISMYSIANTMLSKLLQQGDYKTSLRSSQLALIVIAIMMIARDSSIINRLIDMIAAPLPFSLNLWWRQLWNLHGIAYQYLEIGYFQPSQFGVLIMVAIAFALQNRWRLATVILALTVNLHFSYSIHCGVLLLIFAGWVRHGGKHILAVQLLVIFSILVIPILLYAVVFVNDPNADTANELLSLNRWADFTVPSVFWRGIFSANSFKMIIMFTALIIAIRYRLKFIVLTVAVGLVVIIGGLFYVHFTEDYTVALMFPWRASAHLVPLSIVTIMAVVGLVGVSFLSRFRVPIQYIKVVASFLIIIFLIAETFTTISELMPKPLDTEHLLYQEIKSVTDVQDVILVPIEFGKVRLLSERAVYVDDFNVPLLSVDALEWWDRIQFARQFYENDLREQFSLCQQIDVDYFVTQAQDNALDVIPVSVVDDYAIYAC